MSQAETLQDIYSKLVEIQQGACNGGDGAQPMTQLLTVPELMAGNILNQAGAVFTFSNPDSKIEIADAEADANVLLQSFFTSVQGVLEQYDYEIQDGNIVPNPGGAIVPVGVVAIVKFVQVILALVKNIRLPTGILLDLLAEFLKDALRDIVREILNRTVIVPKDWIELEQNNCQQITLDERCVLVEVVVTHIPDKLSARFDRYNADRNRYQLGAIAFGIGPNRLLPEQSIHWKNSVFLVPTDLLNLHWAPISAYIYIVPEIRYKFRQLIKKPAYIPS